MWRSLQLIASKSSGRQGAKLPKCFYATNPPRGKGKKTFISIIAITGTAAGATIAYAKYDPKFRKIAEENIPYFNVVLRSIPDWEDATIQPKPSLVPDQKSKEAAIESGLLKKKQERQKKDEKILEIKPQEYENQQKESKTEFLSAIKPIVEKSSSDSEKKTQNELSGESIIKNKVIELETCISQAIDAGESAIEAIKIHTAKLYRALESPQGVNSDEYWKEADLAGSQETEKLNIVNERFTQAKVLVEKLKNEIQKCNESGSKSVVSNSGIEAVRKAEKRLEEAEEKISAAHAKSKTATEYKELVEKARIQFRKELQVVLPKYLHKNKDQSMTEDELNLLIAHAHRRIENLQKDLAKHQVCEKHRIEEAKMMQKVEDEKNLEAKIETEVAVKQTILEEAFQKQLDVIREQFEADMRRQLRRQAAVHADHLQEALYIQQQELIRRQNMELDDMLLQQKGIFISQISESMSKLKGIEHYLKARAELDESTQKVQALWLACQAMRNTLHSGFSEIPKPLGKELAVVKAAAGEESSFVTTVLAGIPSQAIHRGVYTSENLKQRFDKVKKICQRVAMVEGNNRSLFRYVLSYMQSLLIIDSDHIPKEEIEGKVNIDPSELDTFDILSRVSYCLQRNDLTKALYYANRLNGEPYNVARDWISEVRLLLETSQAINCLITYAAAIGVQANH